MSRLQRLKAERGSSYQHKGLTPTQRADYMRRRRTFIRLNPVARAHPDAILRSDDPRWFIYRHRRYMHTHWIGVTKAEGLRLLKQCRASERGRTYVFALKQVKVGNDMYYIVGERKRLTAETRTPRKATRRTRRTSTRGRRRLNTRGRTRNRTARRNKRGYYG